MMIVYFFIFFGSLFAVLISMSLFVQEKKTFHDYVIGLSTLGYGIWVFQIGLYGTGIFDSLTISYYLKIIPLPLIFITPPAMYMRHRSIIFNKKIIERKNLFFILIPGFIIALFILVPAFSPDINSDPSYLTYKPVLSKEFKEMPFYFQCLYFSFLIPKFYIILLILPLHFKILISIFKRNIMDKISFLSYIFSLAIPLSNIIGITGDLFHSHILLSAVIISNIVLCMIFVIMNKNKDYNRLMRFQTNRAFYKKSKLNKLDVDKVAQRLVELMVDEKAFTDEDITLKKLANELDITPHQLSELINKKFDSNFNSFINKHRVEEAKKILIDEPDRSIISVCGASGFNSPASFNAAFLKITGVSPREYRHNYLR